MCACGGRLPLFVVVTLQDALTGYLPLFPCDSAQVKLFVDGLFDFNRDIQQFKEHLRDFLVQLKVG